MRILGTDLLSALARSVDMLSPSSMIPGISFLGGSISWRTVIPYSAGNPLIWLPRDAGSCRFEYKLR
uniref:Uncharacterized protein n=1 Tax=Candidatus Kentrum sp. LFY TaxID=2126342 RepID=A0A450UZ50_9GAMM|nr:MAG: hypothetical protein BECKLFY1418B_GA0070995_11093 [Candidatus Kentron sp. LFY]